MKKISLIFILIFVGIQANAQDSFITTWKTDNPGSSNATSITIPTNGAGYSYDVDWTNDGVFDDFAVAGNITHDYGVAGTYTVAIRGDFPRINFNLLGDSKKIISIEQWGNIAWSSMELAFAGCENLVGNAPDTPDLISVTNMAYMLAGTAFNQDINDWDVSNVTNMSYMFASSEFNQDIGNWDVSNVTTMRSMFDQAVDFNQDISGWDVSNVTTMRDMFSYSAFNQDIGNWNVSNVSNMYGMFSNATAFNQDISAWDVSSVTDMTNMFFMANDFNQDIGDWNVSNVIIMSGMFSDAWVFNQDIGDWDVSAVTNMRSMFKNSLFNQYIGDWDVSNVGNMNGMFSDALRFNQDIGNWDVSNVTSMSNMFSEASDFNQNIGDWNVSNVTSMAQMFKEASSFNQDIGSWNVSNVSNMADMFKNNTLSVANYDALLKGWNNLTLLNGVPFNGGNSQYCRGQVARDNMITAYGWNITDGGLEAGCEYTDYFITTWKTNNLGTSNATSITIPTNGGGYSYDVDWNDDGVFDDLGVVGNITHDYGVAGTYTVTIRGDFPRIYFNFSNDRRKILSIEQWGTNTWTSMSSAFSGCINLVSNATDIPDLSTVTDMSSMFFSAFAFNGAIGNWNVANVTRMDFMFAYATDFNQDIGNWDVSSVTTTEAMFEDASTFDQDIANWDVANVTNMNYMFSGADSFNQDINAWDVSNVSTMTYMFESATSFNQNISNWNVSNVTNMSGMFWDASAFNQNIGSWNVSNATNMSALFKGASTFDQDIGNWNVSNVTTMLEMFYSANGFNQDISGWNVSNVLTMRGMFYSANDFNQDIGNWNLSNVTNTSWMFYQASSFNQDISDWDVSNVTNMYLMFTSSAFNQDIGIWNVSNVTNMRGMFRSASTFNQDIGGWDVSSVTRMDDMFENASAFDQNIGDWDVSNVTDMPDMFKNVTLSMANYDALLNGWNNLELQNGVTFDGGNSQFCSGQAAKDDMATTFGWTITDGGQDCFNMCGNLTIYTALDGWSNGEPTSDKKVVFADDYNTTLGSIDACGIEIQAGVTVTVSENTSIKAENNIVIDGDLIFLSNDSGNGELAAMGPASTIIGDATAQRYMSDSRSYRMVSSAVTTSTSIHDNWQEGAINSVDNPAPGFGTHITGSVAGQNGFDATNSGNASMFTVETGEQQFMAIENTDVNTLSAGDGYLLFVRGDRSIDLTDPADNLSSETVLRATGALVVGTNTQNFATEDAGDFILFGNPYQSAVNLNTVFSNSNNINTGYYYIYDPTLGAHGSYVTVVLPGGTNTSGSDANQFLQPGQGAQAAALAAGASSVVFNENDKSPGSFTTTSRPVAASNMLTVQLYTTENFNNGGSVHDSFGIVFADENDNSLTPADALKPMNFYENLGIDHDGTYLSIEQREMPQAGEEYPLYTSGYQHTEYTLKATIDGLETNDFYLVDYFTGTRTLLETGENTYSFTVDADESFSIATNRFSIGSEQRLGVDDNNLLSGIRLYPNPLNGDTFFINAPKLNGEQLSVSISDLTGRTIYEQTLDCRDNTITVPMGENIASGVYMVTLKHGGEENSYRLIKE